MAFQIFTFSHVVTSSVNFNQIESVHQKWRFKTQPSTQVQLFVSNHKRFIWLPTRGIQVVAIDLHMANFMWFRPFLWSLMTKGREMNKDMNYPWMTKGEMRWECEHGHGSRGAILRRINILGQEEHTSRGSKLMNLVVCIWYVHIHVLACICMSFKIYICIACVWCMLVIELNWWFDN